MKTFLLKYITKTEHADGPGSTAGSETLNNAILIMCEIKISIGIFIFYAPFLSSFIIKLVLRFIFFIIN